MTDSRIIQASGLGASRHSAGIWWTHNDTSAPSPKVTSLYALDETTGDVVATLNVTGVGLGDWEDLDALTVGGTSYLWIADTGDNYKNRSSVQLYRVAEPALISRGQTITAAADIVVTLTYPDGPHNVEATFVDPWTADFYLVAKEVPPKVFRVAASALRPGAKIALGPPMVEIDAVDRSASPPRKPTAAEMSADGSLLFIKTLDRTFLWHRSSGMSMLSMLTDRPAGDCIYDDNSVQQDGVTPHLPDLGQGEALGLTVDGKRLATIAEGPKKPLRVWQSS